MLDTLSITRFENPFAETQERMELNCEIIELGWEHAASKDQLPLLKMAYFG